eukprot:14586322-Heterocapsa_arctica.AAC.1
MQLINLNPLSQSPLLTLPRPARGLAKRRSQGDREPPVRALTLAGAHLDRHGTQSGVAREVNG